MNIYLSEKLKELRKAKGISQEKLADYLGVSFQAVSKCETGTAFTDISLLPEISRYFGITVDELLCVEKIDEETEFAKYKRENLLQVIFFCHIGKTSCT